MEMTPKEILCYNCANRKFDQKKGMRCLFRGVFESRADSHCSSFQKDPLANESFQGQWAGKPLHQFKKAISKKKYDRFRNAQHFDKACIAAVVSAFIGLLIWYALIHILKDPLVALPIVIGYGISQSVRKFGKGIEKKFSLLAATFTLLVSLIGNYLALTFTYPDILQYPVMENIQYLLKDLKNEPSLLKWPQFLYVLIGIYIAYRFSQRTIHIEDLEKDMDMSIKNN
ncbi:MAG: hypothetical protein OIF50_16770 [Flavobacteriaceae bacterium]|nr:hypothetical protein [Flavobacteriaceae bacterium]